MRRGLPTTVMGPVADRPLLGVADEIAAVQRGLDLTAASNPTAASEASGVAY